MCQILVVDDSYGNRLSIKSLLEADYSVDTVSSGPEALVLAEDKEYAIILLDVRMPEMDGFESARLFRQNPMTRDTAIVFTSAFEQTDAKIARGYEVGGSDYL